jgi:hypothetical protein
MNDLLARIEGALDKTLARLEAVQETMPREASYHAATLHKLVQAQRELVCLNQDIAVFNHWQNTSVPPRDRDD